LCATTEAPAITSFDRAVLAEDPHERGNVYQVKNQGIIFAKQVKDRVESSNEPGIVCHSLSAQKTDGRSHDDMVTQTVTTNAVVGVFENPREAQACVSELKRSGFRDDEIGILSRNRDHETGDGAGTKAEEGAAIGAATGAGVGALWAIGIAAGVLPAIGPAIAGGIFASILASAAGAAAVGGIVGALVGLGIPEEEARFYESEFKAGRTIVTVKAGRRVSSAREIIGRHHGMLRGEAHDASAHTVRTATTERELRDTDACHLPVQHEGERTMQLKREELHARKDNETAGEVRIRKDVVTEHKTMDVPVTREEVVIERRPVTGGQVTSAELRPGEEVRIPVKEEHVHLEKTAKAVEEVRVGKRKVQTTEHVEGEVRREELRVEKEGQPRVTGATTPGQTRK
jgi:uncharacterized protein (TIGR02271 family)